MSGHLGEHYDDFLGDDDRSPLRDYDDVTRTYTLRDNMNIFSGTYSRPVELPGRTESFNVELGPTPEFIMQLTGLIVAPTASASGSGSSIVASSSSDTNSYATSSSYTADDPAYSPDEVELEGSDPPPSPRTLNVPALPIELWQEILEHATNVPGIDLASNAPTETQDLYDFVTRDPHGVTLKGQYDAALQTKTAVSRVSRYLNRIAQKFLYRYICLRSAPQVSALAYSVKRRAREETLGHAGGSDDHYDEEGTAGDVDDHALFHVPVRLQLSLEATHTWSSAHTAAMQTIFKHCPNLTCFSSAFCTTDPWTYNIPTIISFLQYHGMRRLEVKVDKYVLEKIEEHLGESLEVLYLVPGRRLEALDQRKYLLPKVHTLAIAGSRCDPYVSRLELPRLRTCILGEASMRGYRPFGDDERIEYKEVPEPSS